MKILGIGASQRKEGNTDILLAQCMDAAAAAGADTETMFIRDMDIKPCHECHACSKTGECVIKDGMQSLYKVFTAMDALVIATPVFFYGVPSGLKAVIDRTQCLWARKYVLKKQPPAPVKSGYLISVGGTKGEKLFDCIQMTLKHFFDVTNVQYRSGVFARSVDAKGEIRKHPEKLEEALVLGRQIAGGHI